MILEVEQQTVAEEMPLEVDNHPITEEMTLEVEQHIVAEEMPLDVEQHTVAEEMTVPVFEESLVQKEIEDKSQLKKMNINQLKTIVIQMGLTLDTSKLKKPEIIALIESSRNNV
jgi:hypothetical protein